jgi:hypothetical protein
VAWRKKIALMPPYKWLENHKVVDFQCSKYDSLSNKQEFKPKISSPCAKKLA